MKKPLPTSCSPTTKNAAFNEALADWLRAVEQIQYGYQALEKAIVTYERTRYPFGTTAGFRPGYCWPKADLIALRLTLRDQLAQLVIQFENSEGDPLTLIQQIKQDAAGLRESCQSIQVALGIAGSAST